MHAALPFCSATDKRWNKNEVSRLSPVTSEMRLPSSWKISTASWHHTPVTSHANGANMWFLANSSYLAVLSRVAHSAAAPAWTVRREWQIWCRKRVGHRHIPRNISYRGPMGQSKAPSGRLLAMEPSFFLKEKQRPVGSFWACIFARPKERQITSFKRLCRTCLPLPFLQMKQWWPRASTLPPQMQSCGRQTGAPILNPTAMRSSSFSRKRPQFADGIAKSQSPEWGADAASTRELSRSEGHIDLKCRFIASTTKQSQERCLAEPGAWTGAAEVSSHYTERHWS